MFAYTIEILRPAIAAVLKEESSSESFTWLVALPVPPQNITRDFSFASRKFSKQRPASSSAPHIYLAEKFQRTHWHSWTILDLARLYLLLQLNAANEQEYTTTIESVFNQADLGELTILYKALPYFAYGKAWESRCAEGIRSNMGTVLEAIMYENSYPSVHLPEAAWNQLILKAIFTGKDLGRIYGLEERNNAALAASLLDYAEERLAAGRNIDAAVWPLTKVFYPEKTGVLQQRFLQEK
ncbi:MAG: EboA domain-containing protein [Niabella sp.]|nr:EboA domain-containing protein [Niabella sp.]